ncbi:hypothetical protein [Cohnella rhizosphaerae]|uniref:Uncharacterized protein n=1 Tax=Cohnella rhizosphaerae TaxID=1457232 RepID=A0A9X4QVN2_9BACL|nr:hypothetical protein [Cohnella rhizosphaerae]MDG0812920.1 hypothetical protein [Cohnella rhizosphaerae]
MLDIQYTLEKLAEYRELGHFDADGRIDANSLGGRPGRIRQSLLAMVVALIGR